MKIQLAGACMAAISGILLGGSMQPQLGETAQGPAGPQILAVNGGARADSLGESGATLVSYRGAMPDYVLGTDFEKSMATPPDSSGVSPIEPVGDDAAQAEARPIMVHTAYDEARPAARAYPSQGGALSTADAAVEDDTLPAEPDADS